MNPRAHPGLSDDELNALADNQATPAQLATLHDRLANDPAGQTRLAQWQAQRKALQTLHARVADEPLPDVLLEATQRASRSHQSARQAWRYGGLAATVLMAFGAGWLTNNQWHSSPALLAQAQLAQNFVHQASLAHSVYVPELRHPVEVAALEQAHLVQWLSKRLGKPLKVPNLSVQGFDLVGGRLLPGDGGARAQFMFQDAAGNRVTLYLGALKLADAPGWSSQETAFRFEPQAGVPSFYWVTQGFGYALAGQLPREQLMQLANSVYRQIDASQ